MVKCITNRHPTFLKAAYACPEIDLQNHDWFIRPAEKFIEWDQVTGDWIVLIMLPERVPCFIGRYPTVRAAITIAKK